MHGSKAYGQRGAKLQPGGMLNGFGTVPLIDVQPLAPLALRRDRVEQALGVGVLRARADLLDGALLDDPARRT